MNRRDFLHFLGISGSLMVLPTQLRGANAKTAKFTLPHLAANREDRLVTVEGISHKILLRWGDKLNATQSFGYNNDFIAFHPLANDQGILWVNHEYVNSLFIGGPERSKSNIDRERLEVGGSLVEIKREKSSWTVMKDSKFNRRLDGTTEIPFAWNTPVAGKNSAIGTLANCAGGYTPWGTILTCEENYDMFYGDIDRNGNKTSSWQRWDEVYKMPPQHYGWVVEVDPLTGKAKKLISLGRCAHEAAAITKSKRGKVVAYTGDDAVNEHLYKFISDSSDSLERGTLYVADLKKGEWISLKREAHPVLMEKFKDQTEIQVYAREAAKLVGATPLDRPEDIEFDPLTGNVLVALTNNKPNKNYHGSILKIMETGDDPGSLTFKHDTFLTGGEKSGFSCPDNMVFDSKGNLWFTSDISGAEIEKGPYKGFGNNSLYVFLRTGTHRGKVIRVASGPTDSELTGPCFSPDFKTLFLCVQHPGEESPSAKNPTSVWPDGDKPKPSVITLEGPLLDKIVSGNL
ncbi:MAG TPA: alkaline phosphatase PhoX [Bacteriovoracaceae bacterium]|nr:alkaline phosphatase PhoX [Bacteriovoracaceae bacterium]